MLIWKGERHAPVSDADPPVARGTLRTRRIAAKLHVAVVTVDLFSVGPLEPGELYSYNVTFEFADGATSDLHAERLLEDEVAGTRLAGVDPMAPLHKALGFGLSRLPTFLAPPRSLVGGTPGEGLRIAHCSCRRPAAASFDALAGLAAVVVQPDRRPHQLYMTGDQVYADDISATQLPMVTSLGGDVVGAPQALPGFPPDPRTGGSGSGPVTGAALPGDAVNLPPMRRKWLLWQLAGFTGGDVANHAITFGEYVALHLLAWSPRVWRAIPAFSDVFKPPDPPGQEPAAAIKPWLNRPWFCNVDPSLADQLRKAHEGDAAAEATLKATWADETANRTTFESFNSSAHHLARYAGVTPLVAQALANTPTYMIFDDHEVADDWNLNGRWATRVYNREWGRYVVRNGLMAYTLMQAWGNDPAQFAGDKPGKRLLDAIPAAITTTTSTPDVDVLLGFDKPTATQPKRVPFHYSIAAGDYKAVVLDTRTHRAINNSTIQPPNLIDNLDEQLPEKPATATPVVLIVVSAVPVFSPVVVEQIGQPLAQLAIDNVHAFTIGEVPGFTEGDEADPARHAGCGERGQRGAEKYDREGWSANEKGFEALIARLATYESVVVLSGDVHYASTTTLDYWSKRAPTPARLVQCTSSPAKNIFKDAVDQVVRRVATLQRATQVPMERLAWKEPIDAAVLIPPDAVVSRARRSRLREAPALVPTQPWPEGSKLPPGPLGPDWRWRIKIVTDDVTARSELPVGLRAEPLAATDEQVRALNSSGIADKLAAISKVHQLRLAQNRPLLRRLVFASNFGSVQFERRAADPSGAVDVVHRLYSPVSAVHPLDAPVALEPFSPTEREPRAAGRPVDPLMAFGPHTVHRAQLSPPTKDAAPDIIATKPANG